MDSKTRNREFFELYGQSQNRIYSVLFMMLHNQSDAEDLLQDTAATMLEKFDQYQRGTNFTAWGITIARNKALNFIRKNAMVRPVLSNEIYERIAVLETDNREHSSDREDALQECLRKLVEFDQNILKMRYQMELPMKKIAARLGRSKTGIYHTLSRIHALLYSCVKKSVSGGQL